MTPMGDDNLWERRQGIRKPHWLSSLFAEMFLFILGLFAIILIILVEYFQNLFGNR